MKFLRHCLVVIGISYLLLSGSIITAQQDSKWVANLQERAPRPQEEADTETEEFVLDAGAAVCCPLPRDVKVDRNLHIGSDF